MLTARTLVPVILAGLFGCNSGNRSSASKEIEIEKKAVDSAPSTNVRIDQPTDKIPDTIKRFNVDDYPVTIEMLRDTSSNNSSHKMQSGKLFSFDKAWFRNDSINQTLVFELATDYHRFETFHFYSNQFPADLMKQIGLNTEGGELANEQQKITDFKGFVNQAIPIKSSYFVTNKGFKLGTTRQQAVNVYGSPDKQSIVDGIEKLEWEFIGDELYTEKIDLKGKPLAMNSFGHQVTMYFVKGKLTALILFNDIP
ncbi:hypothetical protein [Polluticoccus soli]|uniref:hypothetical protein n=1 Tax=Polluticoccus soli TaxID=3034150 RepID=UPI0023E0A5DB|nr:hypothetical protein [Flavipsychrobacter sp. JY13-12]